MASKRCWHILRPNHTNETVQQAIWWDTETHSEQVSRGVVRHHLTFGWACHRKLNRHGNWSQPEWFRFETAPQFWDWAISHVRPKTRLYLFDHNTNFDLPVVHTLTELYKRGWRIEEAIIDGPPTIVSYRMCPTCHAEFRYDRAYCRAHHGKTPKRTLRLIDTLNIWRMPLARIGKQIGLEKLEMPPATADKETWDDYGKRDVEIIMQATITWLDWLRENDMGSFAPTMASQAMRAYRHRFMSTPILIDNHVEALQLARDAYHGGRVECGRVGDFTGEFYGLDVNSMYPWVMREHPMPTKLRGYLKQCAGLDLRGYLRDFSVVARVRLETDVPFASVVRDGKLIFPVGRFQADLTTPELQYALDLGAVKSIERCAIYEQAILFRGFVDELYQRRAECVERGDTVGAWQFKILLNSFYGKWGMNGRKWKMAGTCDIDRFEVLPEIDADTGVVTQMRYFGGCVQALQKDGESFESHPAIAAHITAHARMELFKLIVQVGVENYLYCDTDGLLVTLQGFERLKYRIDGKRLGALKQVGEYSHVIINGPKDYVLDGKQTLKGVRPTAHQVNPNTFEQERWSSLKGLIREGRVDSPVTRTIVKRLSRLYTKGVVTQPGGHVQPFRLSEW